MALTDTKIRAARPAEKMRLLMDGNGLMLAVFPTGVKSWRWRYERDGKQTVVTLGKYPEMSLLQARRARDERKASLTSGVVPVAVVEGRPLRVVSEDWYAAQAPLWKKHHAADVKASLEREIWPSIGDQAVNRIKPADILGALRPVQDRGAVDLAHRLRQRLEGVFRYAVAAGECETNPAAGVGAALTRMTKGGHRPATTSIDEARAAITALAQTAAHPVLHLAVRVLALTAVRTIELRGATWTQFDLDSATWTIPGEQMKHKAAAGSSLPPHIVPLAAQTVATLRKLHHLSSRLRWAFPSWIRAGESFSENALVDFHHRAGLQNQQTPHGWRATFSTVMNERFPADRAVIDLMLAHTPKDAVEAAYNRAQHTERRRELAQIWANLLMEGIPEPTTERRTRN